jgi:threonine dehydrogenase-like Zn-dependent dehydrogenase
MDLHGIRTDLAAILAPLGYQSYAYLPDDPQVLPAAVVGVPAAIEYGMTLGSTVAVEIPLTLVFSMTSVQDAQARMDAALSTGVTGSVIDALRTTGSTYWNGSVRVTGAGPVGTVAVGSSNALAVTLTLSLHA